MEQIHFITAYHPSIDLLSSYTPRVTDPSSKIILIIYWLTTPLSCSAIFLEVENCKPPDLQMDFLLFVRVIYLSILQPNNKSQSHSSPAVPLSPLLPLSTPFSPSLFLSLPSPSKLWKVTVKNPCKYPGICTHFKFNHTSAQL